MRRRSIVPKMDCQRNLDVDIETCCLAGICQWKVMFLAGNNQDGCKPRFRSAITKDQKTTSVKDLLAHHSVSVLRRNFSRFC
jgi:hypothetical protein